MMLFVIKRNAGLLGVYKVSLKRKRMGRGGQESLCWAHFYPWLPCPPKDQEKLQWIFFLPSFWVSMCEFTHMHMCMYATILWPVLDIQRVVWWQIQVQWFATWSLQSILSIISYVSVSVSLSHTHSWRSIAVHKGGSKAGYNLILHTHLHPVCAAPTDCFSGKSMQHTYNN